MNNLQKKSMEHTSKLLGDLDLEPIYSNLKELLCNMEISDSDRNKILSNVNHDMHKVKSDIREVKSWNHCILSDLK